MAPSTVVFDRIHLPVLGILILLLWSFVIIRVLGVRKRNIEYHSRWLSASATFISITGVLGAAYFALWIGITVINARLCKIARKHHISDDHLDGGGIVTVAKFTAEELGIMAYYQNILFDLIDAGRLFLALALWITKLAFATSLLAYSYCLKKPQRWALHITSIILILTLGMVIWISSTPFPYENLKFTPDEIIAGTIWIGTISDYYTRSWLEYTLTALNIGTDLLLAVVGCYIIRSLPLSVRAPALLAAMFFITISIAIARLVLVIEMFTLSKKIAVSPDVTNSLGDIQNKLVVVTQYMTEFEVLVSAIVSCFPAIRAWARRLRKMQVVKSEMGMLEIDVDTKTSEVKNVYDV